MSVLPVRHEAYRVLEDVFAGQTSSSVRIERSNTRSPVDRALLTELVMGVLRRRGALDRVIEQLAKRPIERVDAELVNVLRLGVYQLRYMYSIPDYAVVDQAVRLARKVSGHRTGGFVNAVLRGYKRMANSLVEPSPETDLVAYLTQVESFPEWLVKRWLERFGAETTRALLAAQNNPPKLCLGVNTLKTDVTTVTAMLEKEGYTVMQSDLVDSALIVDPGHVVTSNIFRQGLLYVQDEAAQLVTQLVACQPGQTVYDACAAPGGKSIGLMHSAKDDLTVLASDQRHSRLSLLRSNVRRLGLKSVHMLACDARSPGLVGEFDRVIADVPCSGTGTLRRNPELRWRLTPERLTELAQVERDILESLSAHVAVGGRLIYSTCSLEPEENAAVVEDFLERHSDFSRLDCSDQLSPAARELVDSQGVLQTQPLRTDIDGFTAVVLLKEPGS